MKQFYIFFFCIYSLYSTAQSNSGWQRRIQRPLGANAIGCAELQPNQYFVFGNECVDARCLIKAPVKIILDKDGNILSEQTMSLNEHGLVSLDKDEQGRYWLESADMAYRNVTWHLLNNEGNPVKSFSRSLPVVYSADSVSTCFFRYPYGWYQTTKYGNVLSNPGNPGWWQSREQVDSLRIVVWDTSMQIVDTKIFRTTEANGSVPFQKDFRFQYLRNGDYLITYSKGFDSTTIITRDLLENHAIKFSRNGSIVFQNFLSKNNVEVPLHILNLRTIDTFNNQTCLQPAWAFADCNNHIWLIGKHNSGIIDINDNVPYYQKLDASTGEVIAENYGFMFFSGYNAMRRPMQFNCEKSYFSTNTFFFDRAFLADWFLCTQSVGQVSISIQPPGGNYFRHNTDGGVVHAGTMKLRGLIQPGTLPTSHLMTATSDNGHLITHGNTFGIPNVWWCSPDDSIPYIHIIKYDSLGRTTNVESVKASQPTQALRIVPNPATHSITFPGVGDGILTLVDPKGKVWLKREMTTNQSLDISALPAGLYTARLQTAKGLQLQGRFAKE